MAHSYCFTDKERTVLTIFRNQSGLHCVAILWMIEQNYMNILHFEKSRPNIYGWQHFCILFWIACLMGHQCLQKCFGVAPFIVGFSASHDEGSHLSSEYHWKGVHYGIESCSSKSNLRSKYILQFRLFLFYNVFLNIAVSCSLMNTCYLVECSKKYE